LDEASPSVSSRTARPAIAPLTLAGIFLKIGATAFGDTGPVMASIQRELVDTRRVLTADDLTAALTYTRPLPGSTVVQIVAYLAFLLGGWGVSALCTAAFILPSAVAMVVLAAGYVAVSALPALQPIVTGITAAAVGLLLATAYRLGRRNLDGPVTIALAVIAFLAAVFLNVNVALLAIAGGLIGIPLFSRTTTPKTGGKQ